MFKQMFNDCVDWLVENFSTWQLVAILITLIFCIISLAVGITGCITNGC